MSYEVNFDGIVGPTHHYAGLSFGNVASVAHAAQVSYPREAALQGLKKMKALRDLGVRQAVLPPQVRPCLAVLRRLGFSGGDTQVIESVAKRAPELLMAVSSASAMWTANAATVSPSADAADGRVHLTAANLSSKFHRSIETETTEKVLKSIFCDERYFCHHAPLPGHPDWGDEGAANHTRLCRDYGQPGVEFFVFGRRGHAGDSDGPKKFPARQTFEASAAIARLHGLTGERILFAQQNPDAIDAGVFHNDVIGVGNQDVYFFHESSFRHVDRVMEELQKKFEATCGAYLCLIPVSSKDVSVEDAVRSYLFNSQLVTLPTGRMALVAPSECRENERVDRYLSEFVRQSDHPIDQVYYFDLRQSMNNGGGPACLRLRVVLSDSELESIQARVFLDDALYEDLVNWIHRHYRDTLVPDDLRDPALYRECQQAQEDLGRILKLPLSD